MWWWKVLLHSKFCSFSCLSYPELLVSGFGAPEWLLFSPLNILEGFFIIRLDTLHGEVIKAGAVVNGDVFISEFLASVKE